MGKTHHGSALKNRKNLFETTVAPSVLCCEHVKEESDAWCMVLHDVMGWDMEG